MCVLHEKEVIKRIYLHLNQFERQQWTQFNNLSI